MPRKRISMRKIREVLRLKWNLGLSDYQIARSCQISRSTINGYIGRAKVAGLSWPLPKDLDDEQLDKMLYPPAEDEDNKRGIPDWNKVHQELKRKGVTLNLLWQEYKLGNPDSYSYSSYTLKYRQWCNKKNVSMRQNHKAGEKLFVDYAGMTIGITDRSTGEIKQAQVFVATLGASNYTYTEATWSQKTKDWLGSHRRALEFFGGVPEVIVPDNLKSGVKSANYYEPELNVSYADFAEHYGVAIIPARVRKPKDKSKVEVGVQVVEQSILAPLRNRTFFSLVEANKAIKKLLEKLNNKPFQKLAGSRKSVFEEVEKDTLHPLPAKPYELATWKKAKVNIDYHIEVDRHYYSVPYNYVKQQVDIRVTDSTVEVFFKSQRIASHQLVPQTPRYKGKHTTIKEHMPKPHQKQGEWSPERLISWAQKTGEHTAKVVEHILSSRTHVEQGYRSCLGIMRLGKTYGDQRLEAACKRACFLRSYSYRSIESILKNNLDKEPLPDDKEDKSAGTLPHHQNVRGANYYQQGSQPFEGANHVN